MSTMDKKAGIWLFALCAVTSIICFAAAVTSPNGGGLNVVFLAVGASFLGVGATFLSIATAEKSRTGANGPSDGEPSDAADSR
jgi:ABC-type Co2+ transport system permease subunit